MRQYWIRNVEKAVPVLHTLLRSIKFGNTNIRCSQHATTAARLGQLHDAWQDVSERAQERQHNHRHGRRRLRVFSMFNKSVILLEIELRRQTQPLQKSP